MRVIIQDKVTQNYLKSFKKWTHRMDEARDFGYFEKAAHFIRQKNLHDVQFAVPLSDTKEVLVFPFISL